MKKLRNTIINRIYAELKNSQFSLRDFNVELEKTKDFVRILFLPYPEYEFRILKQNFTDVFNDPIEVDMRLVTVESPGEYQISETTEQSSIDDCIDRIPDWCQNISEELSAVMPELDTMESFEKEIEKKINNTTENNKERFTSKEIEELSKKLDTLTKNFTELEQKNEITEKDLKEIKQDIDRMKSNLSKFPKNTWYKTSWHKMIDASKKMAQSKEVRDFLFASAKKFLLGND